MRREPPSGLSPILFVIGYGLLALAWALAEPSSLPVASRGERLGDTALWLGCVALATALVWRPAAGTTSLAGLAVALTPGLVELGADHGDDGLALVAAVALAAGLLRLVADGRGARWWAWLATAASAAVLIALARPSARLGFDDAEALLRGTLDALWPAFAGWIGRAPSTDGGLPVVGVVVWAVALLALVLAAARFGTPRARRVLWPAVAAALVLAALLHAGELAADGEGWFSYAPVVPFVTAAPLAAAPLCLLALLAADLLTRAGVALRPRLAAACFGLIAAVQVLAFVTLHDAAGIGGTRLGRRRTDRRAAAGRGGRSGRDGIRSRRPTCPPREISLVSA